MHWLIALVVMSLGLFSFAQPKSSKSPLPHFIEELKISGTLMEMANLIRNGL